MINNTKEMEMINKAASGGGARYGIATMDGNRVLYPDDPVWGKTPEEALEACFPGAEWAHCESRGEVEIYRNNGGEYVAVFEMGEEYD